jgi:hypothetical protein
VISADLEMAWAWRYAVGAGEAKQRAAQTRANLPGLLALFDACEVPVTWATVGHLLLDNCGRPYGNAHPEIPRPPHYTNEHWRYLAGDWFDDDPGTSLEGDPDWYAPDLVRTILGSKVKHEVACHTFSHVDCSDGHCPPEVMDAELSECRRAAEAWGIQLRSFVFPGNLPGNYASLARHGFTCYRRHGRYHLDVPRQDQYGLWQIPGGICWEKPPAWPAKAWVQALVRSLDRAMESGTLLHLWFHPSCERLNVEVIFPSVLEKVADRRGDLFVSTMAGLADRLQADRDGGSGPKKTWSEH